MPLKDIAIISYRLNGADGVSVESSKWRSVLKNLGYNTFSIAGSGPNLDYLIPELSIYSQNPPELSELRNLLNKFDLIIAENICSLPLNNAVFEITNEAIKTRPAIIHHHDLPWQRTGYRQNINDDPSWQHVVINDLSRNELLARGISSHLIYNAFSLPVLRQNRDFLRNCLKLSQGTKLGLQPTRAIERKNVPKSIEISLQLNSYYWLLGKAEDGYQNTLVSLLADARKRGLHYRQGLARFLFGNYIWDTYEACDFILFPSIWEGFGNPVIESALCKRPLVIGDYPVAREIENFGFNFFHLNEIERLESFLQDPEVALLERNFDLALQYFGLNRLKSQLDELIKIFR